MFRPKRVIQKPKRFLSTESSKPVDDDAVEAIVQCGGILTSAVIKRKDQPDINESCDGSVHVINSIGQQARISGETATFSLDSMQLNDFDVTSNSYRPKRTIQKPKRFLEFPSPKLKKSINAIEAISHPVERVGRRTGTVIKSKNTSATNGSFDGDGEVRPTNSIVQSGRRTSAVIKTTGEPLNTASCDGEVHTIDSIGDSLEILNRDRRTSKKTTVQAVNTGSSGNKHEFGEDAASLAISLFSTEGNQPNVIDVTINSYRPKRTIQKPKRFLEFPPSEPSKSINTVEPISRVGRRTGTVIKSKNTSATNGSFDSDGDVRPTNSIVQPGRLTSAVIKTTSEVVTNAACAINLIGELVEIPHRVTTVEVVNTGSVNHELSVEEDAASLAISLFSTEDVQAVSQSMERVGQRTVTVIKSKNMSANNGSFDGDDDVRPTNSIVQPGRLTSTVIKTTGSLITSSCDGEAHAINSIGESVEISHRIATVQAVNTGLVNHERSIKDDATSLSISLFSTESGQLTNDENIHMINENHEVELITLYVPPPRFLCDASDEENIELLQNGEPTASSSNKRKRNRKSNKLTWAREITKKKRQHGEAYEGYERAAGSKIKLNIPRSERTMGTKCNSKFCSKARNRHCSEVPEAERLNIHKQFWQDMNWDQKKIYVCGLVDAGSTNKNNKYFLKVGTERKQVCRSLFLSTISLKQWMVTNWVHTSANGIIPAKNVLNSRRAAARPVSSFQMANNERRDFLFNFFNELPKMPSHYCRQRTEKQYLEPNFRNLAELYKYYSLVCTDNQRQPLSTCYFSNMFSELKLGLYQPKKDRCDICVGFEKGNVTLEEVTLHVEQKQLAKKEKRKDKIKAQKGLAHVFTMDVQAVQLSPQNKASALYYKQKLKNHDFSMYNLATKDCSCYWWHEGEGDMCASMFTTCVLKHLNRKCNDELPIILWSDGCVYQNRNQILSNALLDYSVREKKIVQQKFLVKGHTQMEVDNIHALIERKTKGKDIDVPSDYIQITEEARNMIPIEAITMNHEDFLQYDNSDLYRYKSIRPGSRPNEATVTDLRVFSYNPDGTIGYKTNFTDQIRTLPRHPRTPQMNYSDIKRVYQEAPKISARRFNDLQDLKLVLKKKFHSFYDNLPHVPM